MNAQEAKAAAATTAIATPVAEKFATQPSFPDFYAADDGRRYDPEALRYGSPQVGYAR